ncbi:MAG: disulfide oxidoreductase [Acidimicrobiales bacterium]
MSAFQAATFFGIMLLGGVVGFAIALTRPESREAMAHNALPIASTVAVGATLGSLYFSEVADFVPCELCWFQRIAMYPLAVLLPLATLRRDQHVLPYALALAAVGATISAYHIQLQAFPDQSSFCDLTNPCSGRWVEAFGFLTIPAMAALSFVLIIGATALALRDNPPIHSPEEIS